jgi:1-acyl-sn-glycerol-3-phosphate acyltransferase
MIQFDSSTETTSNAASNGSLVSGTSRISKWLIRLLYPLGQFLVLPAYFGRITITGQENLPKNGPVILAPTHRSRWDGLFVPYVAGYYVTGRDFRFMITSDECKGLQGWFVKRLGGFAVNLKHPAIATLRHAVDLLHQGEMVLIFPQGGIYRDQQIHQLKPGLARIAINAGSSNPGLGAKIVPIAINYSQPYPNWGTDVSIHIGSPLSVADYLTGAAKQDAKQLTADLKEALQTLTHAEYPNAANTTEDENILTTPAVEMSALEMKSKLQQLKPELPPVSSNLSVSISSKEFSAHSISAKQAARAPVQTSHSSFSSSSKSSTTHRELAETANSGS